MLDPINKGGLSSFLKSLGTLPLIGLIFILLLIFVCANPGLFTSRDPYELNSAIRLSPPSLSHPLGTDELGRDIFARLIYGARLTLSSAALLISTAAFFGSVIGLISGYAGKLLDEIFMRITDLFLSFPQLVLAIFIVSVIGKSMLNAILALSIIWWAHYARLMRAQVLVVKEKEFVVAAKALGQKPSLIILQHLFPNCFSTIIVKMTQDISMAVLLLAALSFLGLGAQPPSPEWGAMITTARKYLLGYWWYPTFPGLAIFAIVLAFSFVSDRVRDLLDPRFKYYL